MPNYQGTNHYYLSDLMVRDETFQLLNKHNIKFDLSCPATIASNCIKIDLFMGKKKYADYYNDFINILIKYGYIIIEKTIDGTYSNNYIHSLINEVKCTDVQHYITQYYVSLLLNNIKNDVNKEIMLHNIYLLFKNTFYYNSDLLDAVITHSNVQHVYKYVVMFYYRNDFHIMGNLLSFIIRNNCLDNFSHYVNDLSNVKDVNNDGSLLFKIYDYLPQEYNLLKLGVLL